MSDKKIYGSWGSFSEMLDDFRGERWNYEAKGPLKEPVPTKDQLLFASYGGGSYEGDAVVIFAAEDKLYEVNGGHCSCFGLEGQWEPEETTWKALAMRERPGTDKYGCHFMHDHDSESAEAYWNLVDANVSAEAPKDQQ